ncbi:MAG TPA: metallophosphoesterase [Gemmatimonadaceae bacterium]|nr:metallophosphoesterase [Gemmatimonadaceae bacterium]
MSLLLAASAGSIAAATVVPALAAVAVYGFAVEPYLLTRTDLDVRVPGLPPELDGYTIAALSDLHCGTATPPSFIARAFAIAQDARPDLVALLGDYSVSTRRTRRLNRRWYAQGMRALSPMIRALRAPDGVVGVLGNHDHYYDAADVHAWLAGLGVRVLVNDSVVVRRGAATLVIGGVDDAREGHVDPAGGCAGQPADAPTVVLAHNPDAVLALSAPRRVDLVLSGHTHGGQVVLPGIGALATHARICTRRAASGWVPNDRAPLYVSRGVGGQHPPRVNCRPEVAIVRLRA